MNPLKWFSKFFCPAGRGQRDFKYSRNVNERLCTDYPGTREWTRFWNCWEDTKYLSETSIHLNSLESGLDNYKVVNLRKRKILRRHRKKNKAISSPILYRIFPSLNRPKKNKMKFTIVNLEDQQMFDVTKIRANGYKIKSCGFPITACTNKGCVVIKVQVGQPNGLLTTRINSSARTINMEVVGVDDNLIQKSLVIKGKTSAKVVDLTSPISDPEDGSLLFKIP